MHHGNGAFIGFLLKIRVELAKLVHQKHALIHHGAGGKGADIGGITALLKDPADDIQLPVKIQTPGNPCGSFREALADIGHGFPGPLPQYLRVHGYIPPAQETDPLFPADHFQKLLCLTAFQAILGKEEHADTVVPFLPQRDPQLGEKAMTNLDHDSHAVAHFSGGILTGPVLQPLHNSQSIVHNAVAGDAVDADNGTDAAGIMLKAFRI